MASDINITDRKRLEESQARLVAIVNSSDDAIIGKTLDGIITSWNHGAEIIFGYSAAEAIGKPMQMLVPPERSDEEPKILARIALGENVNHFETVRVRKDGRLIHVSATISPIRDENGKIIGASKIARDITERVRAEEVMRKASRQEVSQKKTRIVWDLAVIFGLGFLSFIVAYYTDVLAAPMDRLMSNFKGHYDDLLLPPIILLLGFLIFSYRRWKDAKIEVSEQATIKEALRRLHGELEIRVQQRTAELSKTNQSLQNEIAERKRTEQALKLFRMLVDRSNDGIEVIDPETGRFLDINEATVQRLGYSREELLSMSVLDIDTVAINPATWAQHVEGIRQAGFKAFEGQHRRKDGSTFSIEISATYIKMDRDYLIAAVRDITERKRAEKTLRESEDRLRIVTENARVGLVMVNRERRYTFANGAYAEMLGLPSENIVGQRIADVLAPLYDEQIRPNLDRAFAGERVAYELHKLKPGGDCFYAVKYEPTKVDGEVSLVVVVITDITDQRKLEAQLRQAQKMEAIGQLAGGVAHDFNNILAVIQMQADLLKTSENLSPEHKEFADEIGAASQRAAALTRQLLLFGRKEKMHQLDLDLNESINNMTKMLRRTIGENIQMQFKFAMQSLFVHADAGMMDQVLMNLAVNARDAMPNGGKLIIETSPVEFDELAATQSAKIIPGSYVCLSVSDTGCGIPPENLQRIYEPFFTTKEVGKGTGLGLATVFGIVQQHQGWINVYSEVGHGTTFRIYLPRLTKMSEQKSAPAALTTMRGGSETILFVEDDAFLRASVRKALSQLGYRVLEAVNGAEALEIWKQHRGEIRLLLTDMVMPGITGKELGERLLKENPKLKIIYSSGYSAEVAGKDFPLEEGVNFLTKPFQAQKLAQTVRTRLDN